MAAWPRQRRASLLLLRIGLFLTTVALLANNAILRRRLASAVTNTPSASAKLSKGSFTPVKARDSASSNTALFNKFSQVNVASADQVGRGVPKIIHQSWKDGNVPAQFLEWQASWKSLYPGWQYRLWTDADNRRLLVDHYPWFLKTYDALPRPILKADAMRYFYMFHYGGMYADLDMEALRSLEPLLKEGQPVLAFMSTTWWLRHNIPNAWMASPAGHPFWQHCWAHTMLAFQPAVPAAEYRNGDVESVTGPVALMESLEEYVAATGHNVTVLPPGLVYAYDWHRVTYCKEAWCVQRVQDCSANEATFDALKCKAHYPDAYAITYWAHSWGDDGNDTHRAQASAVNHAAAVL